MSKTAVELMGAIARDLRDPDERTFATEELADLLNAGLVEIGRIAPMPAVVDIEPVLDQYTYDTTLVHIHRLELWTIDPDKFYAVVHPGNHERMNTTEAGWELWAGELRVPYSVASMADPDTYVFKAWGYTLFTLPTDLAEDVGLDDDHEYAVREYATYLGLQRLAESRALFTQWQTASGNQDVSLTQLYGLLNQQEGRWNRRRRQLSTLSIQP